MTVRTGQIASMSRPPSKMNFFIEREELEKLYHEEFFSIRDIADIYKCSKATIQKRMVILGIKRRPFINHNIQGRFKFCKTCNSRMPFHSRFKICKDCWTKKNGRERYPNGFLVSKKVTPFSKRKYKICGRCHKKIAHWNKTGYCTPCQNLPGMKKFIANTFCRRCGKAITGHGKTDFCKNCVTHRRKQNALEYPEIEIRV